jgi:hypothetical protein
MFGYLPSGGVLPSTNSAHPNGVGGDKTDEGPSQTADTFTALCAEADDGLPHHSHAAGPSTAPVWEQEPDDGLQKNPKLLPIAAPRLDLRLRVWGLNFADPQAEKEYSIFSGASQTYVSSRSFHGVL